MRRRLQLGQENHFFGFILEESADVWKFKTPVKGREQPRQREERRSIPQAKFRQQAKTLDFHNHKATEIVLVAAVIIVSYCSYLPKNDWYW